MKKFICSVYNGFDNRGCKASVDANGIKIKILFFVLYDFSAKDIIKIINYNKGWSIKIEYNKGTRKNEIIDVKFFRKKNLWNILLNWDGK